MKDIGSKIPLNAAQEILEASSNASDKGSGEFSTPLPLAKLLRLPLPTSIETIVDMTGGRGQLIVGVADQMTNCGLLCEIRPEKTIKIENRPALQTLDIIRVTADVTKFHQVLVAAGWFGDCFVSNFPFDCHWHKENLLALSQSPNMTVRSVFEAKDPRVGRGQIDSTVAGWAINLDRCTERGEGFVIGLNSTMERLVFAPNAPYRALAGHVWLRVVLKGNAMTGKDKGNWGSEAETCIAYWANSHFDGVQMTISDTRNDRELEERLTCAKDVRHRLRHGPSNVYGHTCNNMSVKIWEACKQEWNSRQRPGRDDHNIWVEGDVIKCQLTRFDELENSIAVNKKDAKALFALQGQGVMNLCLQTDTRNALVRAASGTVWRVQPGLMDGIRQAINEYNAVRAPLYPLNPVQKLGYLDEADEITCVKEFLAPLKCLKGDKAASKLVSKVAFLPGKSYKLTTTTVLVERGGTKPNMAGEEEDYVYNGQELLATIAGEAGTEYSFMDARHMKEGITVTRVGGSEQLAADFTLQQLIEHFEIPHVPDVAETRTEAYEANKIVIQKIQEFINLYVDSGFSFRKFQVEDLARAAIHAGLILAFSPGLGKTLSAIVFAVLKCGVNWAESKATRGLVPLKPVLIVAPENLHGQMLTEWKKRFGITGTVIDSQDKYLRMHYMDRYRRLKPGFYLSSYHQTGVNKVQELPFPKGCERVFPKVAEMMHFYGVTIDEAKAHKLTSELEDGQNELMEKAVAVCKFRYENYSAGVGEEKHGIKCVFSPSLADLFGHEFDVIAFDEAIRVKSEDGQISVSLRGLDPKYRLLLTGTPVKNRLKDLFWLLHWAAGGQTKAHARFPYSDEPDQEDKFTSEFCVCERNLTQEAKNRKGKPPISRRKKPRGKPGIEICSIHKLWKLIAPLILRRRKEDVGEDIKPKITNIIRTPMGLKQHEVYRYHLLGEYLDTNGQPAIMAKLQALRSVAGAPNSGLLKQLPPECEGVGNGLWRSDKDYTPKMAGALTVIEQRLRLGQQAVVFSALHEPLDTLSKRLVQAGIPHDVLDGRTSPAKRSRMSAEFERGLEGGAKPVVLAGLQAMAEGNNWPLAQNCILLTYAWALDLMLQAIERVHRLTSKGEVNVWPIICSGSIERKLEAMRDEKNDASELVIDGKLIGSETTEVNLHDLLKIAIEDFRGAETYSEEKLEAEWPSLKAKLTDAWLQCQHDRRIAAVGTQRSVPLPKLMERIKEMAVA